MKLRIQRLDKGIDLPNFSNEDDAAIDLRAAESLVLKPMEKKAVKTGIKIAIPRGYAGLIWDRSGLAVNHSIHTMAGVIDSGYRGEVGVVLVNLGNKEFRIEKGMRVAQMLVHPVLNVGVEEVEELEETKRGENGFGSSGLK